MVGEETNHQILWAMPFRPASQLPLTRGQEGSPMAIAPERSGIGIHRHFTTAGVHPYDEVAWERRDARI